MLISKIKVKVDQTISNAFGVKGRISIKDIYDELNKEPFGFMPCNLTAFVLGIVLKDYAIDTYSYTDERISEPLSVDKMKDIVDEVIRLQITQNPRYTDKYIVAMTSEEKAFNETSSIAFGINKNICTSIEQTRAAIRNRIKSLIFPIWTVKSILKPNTTNTDINILSKMIDDFCGIANSNNDCSARADNSIAFEIGKLSIKYIDASNDLKELLTTENCAKGMKEYLKTYKNGQLITLSNEIGDNGQYINVLRNKFNATDAANWVWSVETVNQIIDDAILEYEIISKSNKVINKTINFSSMINEWCEKCQYIRISFEAAKNHLGKEADFLEILCGICKSKNIHEAQKIDFYNYLCVHMANISEFFNNSVDLFKKVCEFYLDGLSDEEIDSLYYKLPSGAFIQEKSAYFNTIDKSVKEYKSSLGKAQLKKLWEEKTQSSSPKEWSAKNKMPILALVPEAEYLKAKDAFDTLNNSKTDSESIEHAKEYLESAMFYSIMDDQVKLNEIFAKVVVKNYSVLLPDPEEVKNYLNSKVSVEPYEWLGLPEVEKKLQMLAEAKYNQIGCDKALEKINSMQDSDVKKYLKELIKNNMAVGIEIIKNC